jgi:hypothetical protein
MHLVGYILEYCNTRNYTQNILLICTATNMRIALSGKTPLLVYNWGTAISAVAFLSDRNLLPNSATYTHQQGHYQYMQPHHR